MHIPHTHISTHTYTHAALIHSKFFPALQGAKGKMSSSNPNSAIFLTDTPKQIRSKINEFAFSGGGETKEEQEKNGADIEIDVAYQWLTFFLEDDAELKQLGEDYAAGRVMTSHVKGKLTEVLTEMVEMHQSNRKTVTMDVVRAFMAQRSMQAASIANEERKQSN
jgi:tryptophanyl-tRNA synthetase